MVDGCVVVWLFFLVLSLSFFFFFSLEGGLIQGLCAISLSACTNIESSSWLHTMPGFFLINAREWSWRKRNPSGYSRGGGQQCRPKDVHCEYQARKRRRRKASTTSPCAVSAAAVFVVVVPPPWPALQTSAPHSTPCSPSAASAPHTLSH